LRIDGAHHRMMGGALFVPDEARGVPDVSLYVILRSFFFQRILGARTQTPAQLGA